MKVTRKQLRSIVKRSLKESATTKSHLINEGILDFIGNLFMGMVNFAMAPFGYRVSIGEEVSREEAEKVWAKHQAAGKTPPGVESVGDLDYAGNEGHKQWIISAVAPSWVSLLNDADDSFDKASKVTKWTPEDETKEAQEAWKKEHGENAEELWGGVGTVSGLGVFLSKEGLTMPDPSEEGKKAVETGNPAEAINYCIKALDEYATWWSGEGSSSGGSGEVVKAIQETKKNLGELAKAVTADAKEEQAEQKNENNNQTNKVRISRNRLREVIKGVISK